MMPSLIPSFLFVMPTSPLKGPDNRHSPGIWSLHVQVCTRLSVSCSRTRVGVSGMCASPRVHTRWLELCFLPIGEIYIEPQINFIIFSSLIMPTSVAKQAVCVHFNVPPLLACAQRRCLSPAELFNNYRQEKISTSISLAAQEGEEMVGEGKGERGGGGEAAGKRRQGRAKGATAHGCVVGTSFIPSGKQCGCEESIDREGEHPGAPRVMVHDLSGNLLAVRPEI